MQFDKKEDNEWVKWQFEHCFSRIIQLEKQAHSAGELTLHAQLLARLITLSENAFTLQLIDHFLSYIVVDFNSRKEIAVAWVNQLILSPSSFHNEETYSPTYTQVIDSLVNNLKTDIEDKGNSFTYFVLNLVYIPENIFLLLQELCEGTSEQ